MYKVGSGHFCIDLLMEGMSICVNEEDRGKEINHTLINQDGDKKFQATAEIASCFLSHKGW